MFDLLRERQIGKTIAVIREELFLSFEMLFHRLQTLADIGIDSGISERVVRSAFVVSEEVLLYGVRAVTEAQDEVLMVVVGVIFHHMPENWPVTHFYHGFGNGLRVVPETHAQSSTEKHNLHRDLRCARLRLESFSPDQKRFRFR